MKKVIVALVLTVVMILLTATGVEAVNTVSYDTIGTGATATKIDSAVELYTPDGGAGSAYVRLEIPEGINLGNITSVSYNAKVLNPGADGVPSTPDGYAPEVVFNIDTDGDGLEGTGLAWMQSGHNPLFLGGDNFLSGDQNPPTATVVDSDFVVRDALTGYNYWSADGTGADFGSFWSPFASVVSSLPQYGIDSSDKVYSIDFVVGTSGNFNGLRALFSSVELNGVTYPVVTTPPTKACVLIGSGVPGKGLETAPGLQKPFNPNSQAGEHAGKKK